MQEDRAVVLQLASATGLFGTAEELEQFRESLDASLNGSLGADHLWTVAEQGGRVVGATFVAPDGAHYPSAHAGEGVWNMYFIGVLPELQRRRVGSELLQAVEAALVAHEAQSLIVETSGKDSFERIRAFYEQHSYNAVASADDFYGEGDAKVTYRKHVAAQQQAAAA